MTERSVVVAGSGGQGVLLLGQAIACAAMLEGKDTTWFPSYGPEVRGGRAACTVVVADDAIGSPVITHPDAAILLDSIAVGEQAETVRPGGLLFLNASLIRDAAVRDDVDVISVRATEMAEQLGSARATNMVMLGAYAERTGVVPLECLPNALGRVLPERHHRFVPLNIRAIEAGAACVRTGSELVMTER